jgi:hypothetical protein
MSKAFEIDKLLDKLCIDLGFCLPPDECDKLRSNPPTTPDTFTHAVFQAEGLDVNTVRVELFRQVRRYVTEAFRHSATLGHTVSKD